MRRMYSQKQIEALAKQVADYEISKKSIGWNQSQIKALSEDVTSYLPWFSDDGLSDVIEVFETDVGKLVGIDEFGTPALVDAPINYLHNISFYNGDDLRDEEFVIISQRKTDYGLSNHQLSLTNGQFISIIYKKSDGKRVFCSDFEISANGSEISWTDFDGTAYSTANAQDFEEETIRMTFDS